MRSKATAMALLLLFSCAIFAASLRADSYLHIEERLTLLYQKIEAGAARGSLTKNESSRLKMRFFVLKHKHDKYKKDGASSVQYIQLERELTGLEKDTERLLNSLKRR